MLPYQVNMAHGQVIPLETRKQWYRWVSVYGLIMLVCIVWTVGTLTKKIVTLLGQQKLMIQREQAFLKARPGAADVATYAASLHHNMELTASQLEAVEGFQRAGDFHTAGVLLGLATALPEGLELGQVETDGVGLKVGFTVYMPLARKSDNGGAAPHLIALWNAQPLLAGQLGGITSEKSEHSRVGDQEVLSLRFSGTLGGSK